MRKIRSSRTQLRFLTVGYYSVNNLFSLRVSLSYI